MNPIKQCYLAYSEGHKEADTILGDALEMLPVKEYSALEAGINSLQEKAFSAGFRCALRLFLDVL